jgi:hypothetical protein
MCDSCRICSVCYILSLLVTLYRLYHYYYSLSLCFHYHPFGPRFHSRQVRLDGGGYVLPFSLFTLVNPSACVRMGGERSHSYPCTTILAVLQKCTLTVCRGGHALFRVARAEFEPRRMWLSTSCRSGWGLHRKASLYAFPMCCHVGIWSWVDADSGNGKPGISMPEQRRCLVVEYQVCSAGSVFSCVLKV